MIKQIYIYIVIITVSNKTTTTKTVFSAKIIPLGKPHFNDCSVITNGLFKHFITHKKCN